VRIPQRPFFVSELTPLVSGVDFLGLGAVDERLIAEFLPGISNVTRYMRAYSAMTWMAWRFDQFFKSSGSSLTARAINDRFKRFREKVELLFTWGNLGRGPGIIGSQRAFPAEGAKRRLAFAEFGTVAISWLDAAVYGPSMRTESGLGFMERRVGGSLGPTQRGAELAEAIDTCLQRSRYYKRLCDVDDDEGTQSMARDLGDHWSVLTSSKAERAVFSEAFAPSNLMPGAHTNEAARCAAARLIHAALAELGGKGTVRNVREMIAMRGHTNVPSLMPDDKSACVVWTVLQLRQLQRLCHESLLRWVERILIDPPPNVRCVTTEIARYCGTLAARTLGLTSDRPLSDVTALVVAKLGRRNSPLLAGGSVDPFLTIHRLLELPYDDEVERAPGAVLHGLTIAALEAVALSRDPEFTTLFALGHSDRLSIQTLVDLLQSYQSKPISSFVEMLIESRTIGQHFRTAASRLEAGKNKYRFVSSDQGLQLLSDPRRLLPVGLTPDRLETAMSLMRDCGLLAHTSDPVVFALPDDLARASGARAR